MRVDARFIVSLCSARLLFIGVRWVSSNVDGEAGGWLLEMGPTSSRSHLLAQGRRLLPVAIGFAEASARSFDR